MYLERVHTSVSAWRVIRSRAASSQMGIHSCKLKHLFRPHAILDHVTDAGEEAVGPPVAHTHCTLSIL